jgi:predicted DNA-binding transcriptional regulator AlpA
VLQAPVDSLDRSCIDLDRSCIDEDRVRLRRSATSRDLACIKLKPLAQELDTSPWTILRWVRQKRFPAPFQMTPTGPLLWKKSDVAAHIEKCKRSRRQVRRGGQLKQFIKQKGDE